MSRSTHSWLAWSLAGLALAIAAATVAFYFLLRSEHVWDTGRDIAGLLFLVPFTAFPIVGALIASRRPRNPIGWICLVDGLLWMLMLLGEGYGVYGLVRPGSVPFPVTVNALLYSWLWVPAVGLLGTFLILLFPDGKLPSRRWRPLAWISGIVISLVSILTFVTPGPLEGLGGARNPFGIEGQPWVVAAGWILLPLLPLCMLASAASLIFRYRRSGGVERQQIKWIAFAASFVGLVYLSVMGGGLVAWLVSPEAPGDLGTETLWGAILENVMLLGFAGVPVAIGFAVLKHRLYDIDLVINRTLVYATLTALLVALYLGSVVALQYAFRALTGGGSQLAVVASTLAIAALFNPLRRRIQDFIDRRFYRRKYDANRTLEAFSARLREEPDLDRLGDELVSVAKKTMQPAHVSLWLRAGRGAGSRSRGRVGEPLR